MSDYSVKAKQMLFGSNIYSFWCLINEKIVKIERYSAFYLKMYFRPGQVIIRIIYIFFNLIFTLRYVLVNGISSSEVE